MDRTREQHLFSIHKEIFPSEPVEDCWLDPEYEDGELYDVFRLLDEFVKARAVRGRVDYYYVD